MLVVVAVLPACRLGRDPAEVARQGQALFTRFACNACHSIKGDRRLPGPDLSGIALRRTPQDIRAKVTQPDKDHVAGFPQGVMPKLAEKMTPEEIDVLVDYLSTLKNNG
jgi:mono/diheme cytochrome c family protein